MILTFNCLQVQAWLNSLTIQCLSYKKKSHPLTKVFQSCRLCRTICKHAIKMEKNWKEHSFPGTSGGRISIPGYDKTKDYSFLNFEIKRSQYKRPKVTIHKCPETIQGRKLYEEIQFSDWAKIPVVKIQVYQKMFCFFFFAIHSSRREKHCQILQR